MAKIISLAELDKQMKEKKKKEESNQKNSFSSKTPKMESNPAIARDNYNKAKTNLNNYTKRVGVIPGDNAYSAPNLFTIRNQQLKDSLSGKKSLLENKPKDVLNLPKKESKNVETYQKAVSTPMGKGLSNEVRRTRNEDAKAESDYKYQQGLDRYKNASPLSKVSLVLSAPFRGMASILKLDNQRMYEDPVTKTKYKRPSYMEGLSQGIQENGNWLAKGANAVGEQVGKIGTSALLNSIMPYAGTIAYNTDLFDKSYNDTLREGYSTKQATSYAVLSTATEMLTEKLLGASVGKFMKDGAFEETISNGLKKFLKSEKLNKVISSAISEGSEEFVQEFLDNAERNWVLKENNDIFSQETFKNALYSGLIGAISSGTTEGARQLTKNAYQAHIDQITYDIERSYNNDLSATNKMKIENKVLEEYLENDGVVNPGKVVNDFIQEKNTKKQALLDSMKRENLNINSPESQNMINMLTRFIDDKDYNITFDSSIGKNVNGVNINGSDIKLNPNSDRAIEYIAMHEITHSISNEKMIKIVNDYIKHNTEMQEKIKSLEKTYNTKKITEEVLADISGELFSDSKFIQKLKNTEPNSFKKINNVITSLANKVLRGSDKELFIEDLRNKWENAYRNVNEPLVSNKFSIQEDSSGKKYVKVDTNQDIFENKTLFEQTKIAKEYILNSFRDNGLMNKDEIFNVSSKTANEYTHPRNQLPNATKSAKMRASTELNNMLTVSTYLYSKPDDGRHAIAKNGWDYYKTTFEIDNKTFEGVINVAKNGDKKTLYDITQIKRIDQNRSTSANAFSTSLVDSIKDSGQKVVDNKSKPITDNSASFNTGNITQSGKDVKSDVLPNTNNTQKSLNNSSWQEYLEKEFPLSKDVTYAKDLRLLSDSELKELQELRELPFELTDSEQRKLEYLEDKIKQVPKVEAPEDTKKLLPTGKRQSRSEYEDQAIKDKVDSYVRKQRYAAIDEATEAGNRRLDFTKQEKQSFKDQLDKYVGLSTSELNDVKTFREIKSIVEQYANKELTYMDNELINLQKDIRKYRFKPSENIINSIKDFQDFRKNNKGKIIFSKEGSSVDKIYQELSSRYPSYFDSDIYTEADMLYRIEALMNQDTKLIDTYRIDEDSLTSATRDVIQKLQKRMMSDENIEILQDTIEEKALARTREVVYKEYIDDMDITVEELDTGKDINMIDLSRTDPRRLFEKVFDKKVADKLNRELTDGVEHNEALKNKELTRLRDEVKSLGIKPGSKESGAVQKYVEGHYIDEYGDYRKYDDIDLRNEFPKVEDQEKIKNASGWFKEAYSILGQTYNNTLTENGYKPMEMRKNYMPHFQEKGDILSRIGYPLSPQAFSDDVLPTDINALTDEFKPGKKYFSHEQRRTGEKTIYDAIRGFDEYIEGWGNVVYHTEDIQKRRAISKLVRDTWGPTNGTSNENFIGLTRPQQINRIEEIQKHKLSKFAAWIDEQANFIAGKKGKLDRALEGRVGRKIYTLMRAGKKQVGSNMVGLNVRSPLTNFASTIQGFSKTNPIDSLRGYASTIAQIFKKDDLVSKSDFLTNRLNQSERIYTKLWDKASNLGQIFMGATDNVTTNMIYRSKYSECLRKGMSEKEAIRVSDDFTARIMGDHTIGTTASIFNDQTLGILTQFQLEVNNYWSSLIYDNKMNLKNNKTSLTHKVAGMVWQAGTLAGLSYVFNNFMKDLTGSDVMLDFVEMFKTIFAPNDEDEESTLLDRSISVFTDILNQLPFASFLTGGRLPIGEAFKGFSTGFQFLTGKGDKYGNELTLKDVGKDTLDSASYWILPSGKSQLSKAQKGLKMYDSKLPLPGSYTDSGNLRFTAENSKFGKAKAVLFGQYSQKEAQDYIDSGYKSISANKVQEMKDLGMNSSEYRKFRDEFKKATETKDDNKFDIYTDDKGQIYYFDKDNKEVYDSNYKKSDKSIMSLSKANPSELKYNFIANSNLSEANKKVLFNNEFKDNLTDQYGNDKYKSKDGKTYWYDSKTGLIYDTKYKDVSKEVKLNDLSKYEGKDFNDYDNYDSLNELDYKTQNPAKYSTITQITSYDNYKEYESKIADIKDSNKNASRSTRKNKVIKYVDSIEGLTIPQKAMLIRLSYSSYNDYNKQIVDYINKQDISNEEKTNIFKKIGFEVKKGKVYYK